MTDIVLLDPATDQPVGTMEKLEAHRQGRYHSAISVLLLDSAGRHIMQRRAAGKYHSAGLWANACCSHPLPGEPVEVAAKRRLSQEMGISCTLAPLGTIRYRAPVPTGPDSAGPGPLIEYEHVALFGGMHDGPIVPDPEEACETELVSGDALDTLPPTVWFSLYRRLLAPHLQGDIAAALAGRAPKDYGAYLDLP